MRESLLLVLYSFFLVSIFGFVGVQYDPAGLILIPPEDSLNASLEFNKPKGSTYYAGEELIVSFRVNKDAYVTLLDILPDGKVQVLFPNKYDTNNFVKADELYTLPTTDSSLGYRLIVDNTVGRESFLLIASEEPLYFLDPVIIRFHTDAFPYLINNVSGMKNLIMNSLTNSNWTVASYYFYANYVPVTTTTNIISDRENTRVYIDGLYAGTAPIMMQELEVGQHSFYLFNDKRLAWGPDSHMVGFGDFEIKFNLFPTYPYGYLEVYSEPSGASVYIDGEYFGTTPIKDFAEVGSHNISISKWKYHSASQDVEIIEGETSFISFVLSQKSEEEIRKDIYTLITVFGVLLAIVGLVLILAQ
ncbi:hypothetical protein AT15_08345 [Kosmotoga arenicorallina S304]|uniref:PEGA domain-containing protein n=1 Tax=Kosmotoga arenicorallina S304 TaxID=1453497 RepID=A0A176K1U2_9BACT|nr:DUF4384 domain-containing protein [Kosmotoga arenicorallina]OAA30980.1 hypothetical protein AT15_08345 [Kosmotoga arenicorallina S304]